MSLLADINYPYDKMTYIGGADPREASGPKDRPPVVDTLWSYEPVKRCWFREVCMNVSRQNFGLVVTNQCLYAIGGQDSQGRYLL